MAALESEHGKSVIKQNNIILCSHQEWKGKLEEAQKAIEALKAEQSKKQEMMKTIPHVRNLNEDEQLCGMIVYFFGISPRELHNTLINCFKRHVGGLVMLYIFCRGGQGEQGGR